MYVLVTGAAGNLGSATCQQLKAAGIEFRATDVRTRKDIGYRVVVENLLHREACYQLADGCDAVVHIANRPNEHSGSGQAVYGENCTMNINIFQAAIELGVKKIIYASSIQTMLGSRRVSKYQGQYVMVFRNDYGRWNEAKFDGTNIGLAFSKDGINWEVQPKACFDLKSDEITRAYDPRLTVLDGVVYMCFAVDTKHGVRGGIAKTEDFCNFEVLSISAPDNRNMVLFPEKVHGRYARLERPMPVYSRGRDRFDMWFSDSPDLRYWGNTNLVMGVEHVPYANDKIGPAAPPIKTKKGWLTTIHAVDRDNARTRNGWEPYNWQKRYCAGICLLDLNEPWKVIGLSREPLLAPEASYEIEGGFRNYVIFPGGMILEDTGEVKIYYGAADTYECLATAHVDDLLALCKPV